MFSDDSRPMERWLRSKPELRGGFSASDIRKATVTLGDPDVFGIRSDLASLLGHSVGLATYSNPCFHIHEFLSSVVPANLL